jgi:hypothetical protein
MDYGNFLIRLHAAALAARENLRSDLKKLKRLLMVILRYRRKFSTT